MFCKGLIVVDYAIIPVPPKARKNYLELLLLADPDPAMLARYLDECEMYLLTANGQPVSEVCITEAGEGCIELKNVATAPEWEGRGAASYLIRTLLGRYAGQYHTAIVGTAEPQVGFYQRLGFVRYRVEKGFFLQYAQPVYEGGLLLEDMVYLKQTL